MDIRTSSGEILLSYWCRLTMRAHATEESACGETPPTIALVLLRCAARAFCLGERRMPYSCCPTCLPVCSRGHSPVYQRLGAAERGGVGEVSGSVANQQRRKKQRQQGCAAKPMPSGSPSCAPHQFFHTQPTCCAGRPPSTPTPTACRLRQRTACDSVPLATAYRLRQRTA
jgi:hypothetical protein